VKSVGLLLALFFTSFGFGQSDFIAWTGLEVKTSLTKKIGLSLKGQTRFDRNSTHLKTAFISTGLKYDFQDHFRVRVAYRLSSVPFDNSTSNRIYTHRYNVDAELRDILGFFIKKTPVNIHLRLRGTHEYELNKLSDNYLRTRIKASYDIKKSNYRPHVSVELFYHLRNQIEYTFTEVQTHHAISKFRMRLGVDYTLKKRQQLSLFGIYQKQLFNLKNDFILGASYCYKISFKKKNPIH
jgi:hypothetical protein